MPSVGTSLQYDPCFPGRRSPVRTFNLPPGIHVVTATAVGGTGNSGTAGNAGTDGNSGNPAQQALPVMLARLGIR